MWWWLFRLARCAHLSASKRPPFGEPCFVVVRGTVWGRRCGTTGQLKTEVSGLRVEEGVDVVVGADEVVVGELRRGLMLWFGIDVGIHCHPYPVLGK